MKLHNLSVIFIVIAIPLILITSYYISLQIDTINMQTAYNTKLLDSTKEAIDAFEINTVEWNANYSETADSKRRDVMASINTFTTSFANNIGVGGTSKEYILSYMPAIAYTLYDGYYIYSPANTRVALTDDNGVGITMTEKLTKDKIDDDTYAIEGYTYESEDKGKLLYVPKDGAASSGTYYGKSFTLNPEDAATEYKHILKPFAAYSEKIGEDDDSIVINYTLDNYVTVYGNVKNEETGEMEYVFKAGYLTDPDKITGITHNSISGIQLNGSSIAEGEYLSEQIAYKRNPTGNFEVATFNYVYEASGNTKVYFDKYNSDKPFTLNSDSEIVYVENLTKPLYKKCTIPKKNSGEITYLEIYQNLLDGSWYTTEDKVNYNPVDTSYFSGLNNEKKIDYSAINYCVESYVLTNWVNNELDLRI